MTTHISVSYFPPNLQSELYQWTTRNFCEDNGGPLITPLTDLSIRDQPVIEYTHPGSILNESTQINDFDLCVLSDVNIMARQLLQREAMS